MKKIYGFSLLATDVAIVATAPGGQLVTLIVAAEGLRGDLYGLKKNGWTIQGVVRRKRK